MPLDDRITVDLRRVDEEPVPDLDQTLDALLPRARRRRVTRTVVRGATVLSVVLIVAGGVSVFGPDEPDFSTHTGEELIAPTRAPKELREYQGIEDAFRLARGHLAGDEWSIWAYEALHDALPCLALRGIGHAEGHCFIIDGPEPQWNLPQAQWNLWRISGRDGDPDVRLVYGFVPRWAATVVVHHPNGRLVEIPTLAAEGLPVRFFVGPPDPGYGGSGASLPESLTMRDSVGRPIEAIETTPSVNDVRSIPRCGPGQYTPDLRRGSEVGQATVVRISMAYGGLRGEPIPCRLLVEATLTITDPEGDPLPIRNNGSVYVTDMIASRGTSDFPFWKWLNWCGEDGAVATVHLGDGRTFEADLPTVPTCVDADRPSLLALETVGR